MIARDSSTKRRASRIGRLIFAWAALGGLGVRATEVTIEWEPPTCYADGSQLKDLAGFRLYRGVSSRSYDSFQDVGTGTYVRVSNLQPGVTYYFSVTTYDSSGLESPFSEELTWVSREPSPPVFTSHPASLSVTEPGAAIFAATAEGDAPLTYQWRRNGIDISGANGSSYEVAFTDAASDDGAQFDVVASNPYGVVTSRSATLTVYAAVNGRRPRLSWEAVENATAYEIWIFRNGETYHTEWLQQSGTTWAVDFDMEGGEYTWWVRAWTADAGLGEWVGPKRFAVLVAVPDTITLQGPSGTISSGRPTFSWNADPTATWYELRLDKDGGTMQSAWLEGLTGYTVTTNLPFGNYRWWVRGWSPDGYGEWSEPMSFVYGKCEALSPTGNLPGTRQPEFTWSAVEGADAYRIVISRSGATYLTETVADVTSWTPSSELPSGSYDWSVQAWNRDGYGPTSSQSFSVFSQTSVQINIEPPSQLVFSPGDMVGPFYSSIANTWHDRRMMTVKGEIKDADGTSELLLETILWVESQAIDKARNGSAVYFEIPDSAPIGTCWHIVYVYDSSTGLLLDFSGFPFDVR